jgi:hemolysin III
VISLPALTFYRNPASVRVRTILYARAPPPRPNLTPGLHGVANEGTAWASERAGSGLGMGAGEQDGNEMPGCAVQSIRDEGLVAMRAATGLMRYSSSELAADGIIHLMGTFVGVVGSAIMVGVAGGVAELPVLLASLVYSICLLTMLGCSAAYNLTSDAPRKAFLRKLDHAAIFLMIGGTYTPFTTCRLHGLWAIGMTSAIWTGAITGAATKLIRTRGRNSIVAYLALGWMILVGLRPMLASVDAVTAILIGVGGVLYSVGVGFHVWRALPFHNAIWHAFVLVAASCHYAAVLHGVVLARS